NFPTANLILQSPGLFGIEDFAKVVDAAKPMFAELANLSQRARRESRLAPAMWYIGPIDEAVHIRGLHKSLGELVPQRFLEALAGPKGLWKEGTNERLELAQQVT